MVPKQLHVNETAEEGQIEEENNKPKQTNFFAFRRTHSVTFS